jgi:transcriptional regulator with XRE-family HTH domain
MSGKQKSKVTQGAVLLKQYRKKEKITQEDLAEKLGCGKFMLNRYEKGVHIPQGRRLFLFRDVCNIPVESWYLEL